MMSNASVLVSLRETGFAMPQECHPLQERSSMDFGYFKLTHYQNLVQIGRWPYQAV